MEITAHTYNGVTKYYTRSEDGCSWIMVDPKNIGISEHYKVALVTGGTRGIGLAIVNALRANGYSVAVVSRDAAGLPTPDSLFDDGYYISADLRSAPQRFQLVQRVVERTGRLDLLVNNAGEQTFAPATEYSPVAWERAISLMLTAPFDLSQQAARHMLKNGGGHIVNILSTSAFQGARNIAGYVAAKHGLLGLTRALAIEWAPLIHVNAVAPGLTDTDMTRQYISPERRAFLESITPAGRFCTPEEIAEAVVFVAGSSAMYGQCLTVDNGWLAKNG